MLEPIKTIVISDFFKRPHLADPNMSFASQSSQSTSGNEKFKACARDSESDEEDTGPFVAWRKPRRQLEEKWRIAPLQCAISLVSMTASLVAILVVLGSSSRLSGWPKSLPLLPSGQHGSSLGDCGSTWQEAQQLGCVFDVMATDWVRAECKHKELSDAYFANGNWTYYRDAEGTDVIPHEELLTGKVSPYWTEGSYHFSHCSYVWHKHLRQMGKKQMLLDSKSRNWEHSYHCLYMLAKSDTSYINNKTGSMTVLGNTKTGDSVSCVAGEWESSPVSIASGFQTVGRELEHSAHHA